MKYIHNAPYQPAPESQRMKFVCDLVQKSIRSADRGAVGGLLMDCLRLFNARNADPTAQIIQELLISFFRKVPLSRRYALDSLEIFWPINGSTLRGFRPLSCLFEAVVDI